MELASPLAHESSSFRFVNSLEPPVPATSATRRAVISVAGFMAAVVLAAYSRTFSAPFVFDDIGSIVGNPTIRRLSQLHEVFSPPGGGLTVSGRPLLNFSLAVNYAISGEAVWSYHAVNLAIHFLAACTLFGVVRRSLLRPSLRARWGGDATWLAAAVAGLWLLQPLQTESVTYVSQRAESLAGLFCLLTFYGFIRAADSAQPGRAIGWRGVSCTACLLGMATKEVMVAVPLLVMLYDGLLVGGGLAVAWRERRGYYVALASSWVLLALVVFGNHDRGGTAGARFGLTPLLYFQTQCRAVVLYLQLSVWPHPQVFDYGQRVVRHFADVWLQAVLLAALLLGTAVALWRRSAAGFLGASFFAILAPSSSVVPVVSQTMAEHRMYLPLAAVVTIGVVGLFAAIGRRSLVLWPVVAVGLGLLTHARNETYRSELALWHDTAAKLPHQRRAHYNLAMIYARQGRYTEALAEDEAALPIDESWLPANEASYIHSQYGSDLTMAGRPADAIAHCEEALRLKPGNVDARRRLARALVQLDRYSEAIGHFEEALRLESGDAQTELELGDALTRFNRPEEAIAHYRAVLRIAPASVAGFSHLANALFLTGRIDESIAAYREAVRYEPRHAKAWMGLGYALITAGRPAEAIAPCAEAARLQPQVADGHNMLGVALLRAGRAVEAVAAFEQALRLDSSAADTHNNLGNALAAAGRASDAIAQYREALRLDPGHGPARRNLDAALQSAGQKR